MWWLQQEKQCRTVVRRVQTSRDKRGIELINQLFYLDFGGKNEQRSNSDN